VDKHFSLRELADYLEADIKGDPQCLIHGLNTLQDAVEGELAFLASPAYTRYLVNTRASAVVLSPKDAGDFKGSALVVANPYLSYARLTGLFDCAYQFAPGIHHTSSIHETASVSATAQVEAGAVIEAGAQVGEGVYVGSNTVIGKNAVVGNNCYLHANVTLYHGVCVGDRVVIHSGAVIGADGFGFANDRGGWVKIHQLGGVAIGDDVEIGACTTIDRGALGDTVIGNGVIIDNLVQIAHNVEVGDNSALAGCSAIAGSTRIGRGCVLAGGAGLVGHIELCDGVTVTGRSMITKSIREPGVYSSGTPFEKNHQWRKNAVRFNQLDAISKRLSALEKQLTEANKTDND
jgi:UDP-3-O-[3-hydroxymyristoyl] glucosamine N-acyltransferase